MVTKVQFIVIINEGFLDAFALPSYPSDVIYAHERATVLAPTPDWSSANVTTPQTTPLAGNFEAVKVRSTVPIGSMNAKEFLHLRVTLP